MDFMDWRAKRGFDAKTRAHVWKKTAVQIKHGIPFYHAIEMLWDRAKRKKKVTARVYEHILRNNHAGGTLASALVGYATPEEIMLISAGEKKDLSNGLTLACTMMSNKDVIRKQVIGASAYPLFLLMLCAGVLCVISFILVPEFSKMLPQEKWTGIAAALLLLSNFVASVYGAAAALLFVFTIILIFLTFPVWTGTFRIMADKFPPWSIYREIVGSSWLFSVATLMSAGIQPRQIFSESLMSRTCTPYLKERISAIDYQMSLGKNIGVAMQDAKMEFPSEEVVEDMCVYAELPDLEKQISDIAQEQMIECIENVKQKMKIIQTTLMFTVAILIVFVLVSIYSLVSAVGQSNLAV